MRRLIFDLGAVRHPVAVRDSADLETRVTKKSKIHGLNLPAKKLRQLRFGSFRLASADRSQHLKAQTHERLGDLGFINSRHDPIG